MDPEDAYAWVEYKHEQRSLGTVRTLKPSQTSTGVLIDTTSIGLFLPGPRAGLTVPSRGWESWAACWGLRFPKVWEGQAESGRPSQALV